MLTNVLGLFCTQKVLAQTFSPDFVDGVVYFKLRDTSNVTINGYNSLIPNTPNYDSLTVILQDSSYLVNGQVIRPFTRNYASPLNHIYRINFGDYGRIDMLIVQLQMLSYIEYAEKEPIMQINSFPPDDYTAAAQWYLDKINAVGAWDLDANCVGSHGGAGIVVAIVDNAIKYDHEDLIGQAWNPTDTPGNNIDEDANGFLNDTSLKNKRISSLKVRVA